MKAQRVRGLSDEMPFADAVARIVRVRVAELYSFSPAVLDPAEVDALHDMRIAAKRLRYILEMAEPILGEVARRGASRARALQDVLGEIHDCDELLPRVRAHGRRLRAEDLAALSASAAPGAPDLDPAAVARAPNRGRHRGIVSLATYLRARREVLYRRFVEDWAELESGGFREDLLQGLTP